MIFKSATPSLGDAYPHDLDVYSFVFEHFPADRPDVRGTGIKLLIDDDTGLGWSFEEIKERVDALAVGMREKTGTAWDTSVGVFSANSIDYPVAVWASHRLGATVSAANPAFQPSELSYQLEASKASLLFVGEQPETLKAGFAAAEKAGIPRSKIVVIQNPISKAQSQIDGAWTLSGLVDEGRKILKADPSSLNKGRRKLAPGEGKKKLAFLSFSSGTTGLPKGVAIQHSAPIANVLQFTSFNKVGNKIGAEGRFVPGKDVSLGVLPMFHIYGLVVTLHAVFYAGIPNVVVPKFKGIKAMLESTIKYRITVWWLVPPQVVLLCKDPAARPYHDRIREIVRVIMIGAAPLSDDLSRQLGALLPGVDWGQGYGMTETCTVTLMFPVGEPSALGSAGRLVTDTDAKIVTPEGRECGYDEPGELWIRGPQNTLGYMNNAQATKEMFLDGNWVRTGDEVIFKRNGDAFIVDRLKELIKVKGFQVAPAELEGWLLNHPDVSDVGVIGIQDEAAGELPLAYVMLSEEAKARLSKGGKEAEAEIKTTLMKHVSDHKIRYKHLAAVEIIDVIPKTASGKILRRNLRDMAKKLPPIPPKARL